MGAFLGSVGLGLSKTFGDLGSLQSDFSPDLKGHSHVDC